MNNRSADVQIRQITAGYSNDFAAMLQLFEEVFVMKDFKPPSVEHLTQLLNDNRFIALVAAHEDHIIGGLTAHGLTSYYTEAGELYVYDLAIAASWQRKGVGTRLMQEIITIGKQEGYREVFVQADRIDQHALDFYQALGGQPEEVIHFTFDLMN